MGKREEAKKVMDRGARINAPKAPESVKPK